MCAPRPGQPESVSHATSRKESASPVHIVPPFHPESEYPAGVPAHLPYRRIQPVCPLVCGEK